MHKIRLWLRRYFRFSQSETNGFLLLLVIVIAAIVIPLLYTSKPNPYNPAKEQATLDSLVAHLDTLSTNAPKYSPAYKDYKPKGPVKLNLFNPNTVSAEELRSLGFSKFAANNILKYRTKAGNFTYKEQLQRIYGITPEFYSQIEPYINLPTKGESKGNYTSKNFKNNYPSGNTYPNRYYTRASNKLIAFDLNMADTSELKKICGIGSKLSARIVKFRDKLGGFANQNQLTEVYGLSPEVIDSLRKYTFIPAGFQPKQININHATFDELRAHPYVGFNLAKLIIAYRTQHGPFKTKEDILKIKQVTEAQYQKLNPYLAL